MNYLSDIIHLYPILSLINSVILFFGLFYLGEKIVYYFSIDKFLFSISDTKYQNILISVNFISAFLFISVLTLPFSKLIINVVGIVIYISGIIQLLKIKYKEIDFYFEKDIYSILILITLIGYFLLSFAPNTHGDALAYHIDVAKYILNEGTLPNTVYNFHHLLVGAGEVIIAIGYIFEAEQFNSLVQFSGVLSIYGIFKKKLNVKNNFLLLIALTSPIIIFLISASKPQLFPLASNFLIFSLIFFENNYLNKNKVNFYKFFIFICLILINSINTKFSFVLSSFFLFIFLFWFSLKKKLLKEYFFCTFVSVILFYLPFIFWKYYNFGGTFIEYFFNPFSSSIPASEVFKTYLTNFKRDISPLYLIFPKDSGVLIDNLGLGVILIFCIIFIRNFHSLIFLFLIIIYLFIGYNYGQPSSRFFLEPFLWTIFFVSYYSNQIQQIKYFKILCIQSIFSILIIWFGVFTLSIGSLSFGLRDYVLTRTADGYSLYKWANKMIKDERAIISIHRAIAFGKNKTISTDYVNFINQNLDARKLYINQISKYNPKYLVTWGRKNNLLIFENCILKLLHTKKNVGFHGTRNPFNRGSLYDGFIYEIKDMKLNECIN